MTFSAKSGTMSTPNPAPEPGPYRVLTLLTLLQIIATASVLALTALAPVVAEDLAIGEHWIGYQISLIYFFGLFASASAGSFVARYGAARLARVELALFGAGIALVAMGRLETILLASVLLGVGYGINNPVSSELLHRVAPSGRHALIFSVKQSGVPLGAVVANVGLPAIAFALGLPWELAVLWVAVAAAVLFVPLARTFRPRSDAVRRAMSPTLLSDMLADQRYTLRNPAQRVLAALGGLYSAAQLIVTAFVVVSLIAQGWTPLAAGSVAALMQVMGAVGRIGWGWVADRFGAFQVLAFLGAAIAVCALLLMLLPALPVWVQAGVFVGIGGVVSGWNGVMLAATAQTAPPGQVGRNTGAVLVYTFLGVIIGPSVFAALYGVIGAYPLCFGLVVICGVTGAALAWSARRALPRAAAPA
jgi:MFS family permease